MIRFKCPDCGKLVELIYITEDGDILGCDDCIDRAVSGRYEQNRELYEFDFYDYKEFMSPDEEVEGFDDEEEQPFDEHDNDAYWREYSIKEDMAVEEYYAERR